jgi:FkbM family methyltransferase
MRTHPIARSQPAQTLWRLAKADIINKALGYPFLVSHDFGPTLIVDRDLHSTRGHYFFGLHAFNEELFAIHFLRKDELFLDIGANLGIFSIIVAITTGARAVAVEPSPSSAMVIRQHIALNDLSDRVVLFEACVGDVGGVASIQNTVDMDNFVVVNAIDSRRGTVDIPMVRIDDIVRADCPCVMKMDVEGFEMQALQGATKLLGQNELRAISIEVMGISTRFGFSVTEIHDFITSFGFAKVGYDSLSRNLLAADDRDSTKRSRTDNVIYVRDIDEARHRVKAAPQRTLLGKTV